MFLQDRRREPCPPVIIKSHKNMVMVGLMTVNGFGIVVMTIKKTH